MHTHREKDEPIIARLFVRGKVVKKTKTTADFFGKHILARWLEDLPVADVGDSMFEVEFTNAPLEERFMRFGCDPTGMRQPIPIEDVISGKVKI